MKHLDGILDMVDKELGSIEKNGQFRSRDEVDSVYKLIDIAKDAYCIWKYEEEMDGESYAYDGGGYGGRSYRYDSYDDGESYARGRGRNARRDRMGRYSREYNRDGMSYRRDGYSRDDAREEYTEKLRRMMDEAPDQRTREAIERMMDSM